jgi:hypothetical protein
MLIFGVLLDAPLGGVACSTVPDSRLLCVALRAR